MKRSTLIAIVILSVSAAIGGVLGFYFYVNNKNVQTDQYGRQINTGSGNFGSPSVNISETVPGNATTSPSIDTNPVMTVANQEATMPEIPVVRQIHSSPTAGAAFFSKDIYATTSAVTETVTVANAGTTSAATRVIRPAQTRLIGRIEVIEFMDRATGHIYETPTSSLDQIKLFNTTIPKVYESSFIGKGSVLMRDLLDQTDTIRTRLGTEKAVSATSAERIIDIQDLPTNITQLAISPNKSRVFYVQDRKPVGVISNLDGKSAVTAFDSPFTEWLVQWPTDNLLTITTKPSWSVEGFMYSIDVNSKAMRKVLGNIKGLTTLMSPNGDNVLYSESRQSTPNLMNFNRQTGAKQDLYMRTLPEKCVWSQRERDVVFCAVPNEVALGDYPDVWYQGLIFFRDSLWKINVRTGESRLVVHINNFVENPLDMVELTLDPSETYMIFKDKTSLTLWGLKLVEFTLPRTATSTATTTPAATR